MTSKLFGLKERIEGRPQNPWFHPVRVLAREASRDGTVAEVEVDLIEYLKGAYPDNESQQAYHLSIFRGTARLFEVHAAAPVGRVHRDDRPQAPQKEWQEEIDLE